MLTSFHAGFPNVWDAKREHGGVGRCLHTINGDVARLRERGAESRAVWKTTWAIFWKNCKKSVKTAVPDDGRSPGALVSAKLIEWYCGKLPGPFFGKIAKIWKKYNRNASATKGRASRAPFAGNCLYCFLIFCIFSKKCPR